MRDLFTICKVGVISSADAGSAGYKSFCWLGRTVDSYLWKENTVFYSKKCCWEWRILASLGSYSQREQILKLDENIHWWHTARIPPLPWDCALQKSWNELVLKAPEWQIPVIPPEGWVRSSLAQFPHEAWLRAWQPPQRLFFGREAVAIPHPGSPHRRNAVMPADGVELHR